MDILGWLWWAIISILSLLWSLIWFLISGWVSTLLQIAILIAIIYYFKYGWQRAPVEVWRQTRAFARFFWSWVRARDPSAEPKTAVREVVKIVRVKEFGDISFSTLLSLLALGGLFLLPGL